MSETVLRELEGMRALARSLVHGDADADDLLQDAAVAALEHPTRSPPRPWLAVVLRNRRRMDARAAARRATREQAVGALIDPTADFERPDAALDRARAFERLGKALVELEEPFRTTVIKRYLDGQSAAAIAEALGVPAGTVRWRLKEGLDRLRAALDENQPRWRAAFAPLAGAAFVKSKTPIIVILVLLLLGAAGLVVALRKGDAKKPAVASQPKASPIAVKKSPSTTTEPATAPDPLPGQGRVVIDKLIDSPGVVSGRVINWSTGDGVDGADLTFTGDGGAVTVRSRANGVFELAPTAPGHFALTAISAPGFLPYAPELLHSNVYVEVLAERTVKGITVFLFPAVDYHGHVVDAKGAAVAGAHVRLLGTPTGEQAIDKLDTEWTTDKDGSFTFHAADDAIFEATRGPTAGSQAKDRGWARLDGDVALTHQLTIVIGNAPARNATITGRVLDNGKGVANVLVRAEPETRPPGKPVDLDKELIRSTAFATTNADGTFVLEDLDRETYTLATQAEGYAPASSEHVAGGSTGVTLALDRGATIAGSVVGAGDPIGAYTLLVFEREGTRRDLLVATSIVDATGRFEVRVPKGEYELQASASGWAPSGFVVAKGGDRDVALQVTQGATLRGQVIAGDDNKGIPWARIMREGRSGGASAQPANAGTVTRADGTFELTGIPPGPVSITIGAGGFHPRIEAGMTATDGGSLGPLTIHLQRLKEGEKPTLELVGIGVKLSAAKDGLSIDGLFPGGGAADAGLAQGETITAVDGISVMELGLDGSVSKIRGVEGTTVSVTVKRGDKLVTVVCTRKKLKA